MVHGYTRFKDGSNKRYTRGWDIWFTIEQNLGLRTGSIPASVRNAIIFFCLSATYPTRTNHPEHPSLVFWRIFFELIGERVIPSSDTILSWLDTKAAKFGFLSLSESLQASIAMSAARRQFVHEKLGPGSSNELTAPLIDGYDQWLSAHEHMCQEIIRSPMSYCDPVSYLMEMERWVASPPFITTDTPFFSPQNPLFSKFQEMGFLGMWGVGEKERLYAWTSVSIRSSDLEWKKSG